MTHACLSGMLFVVVWRVLVWLKDQREPFKDQIDRLFFLVTCTFCTSPPTFSAFHSKVVSTGRRCATVLVWQHNVTGQSHVPNPVANMIVI